eukprot:477485_1
MLLIVLQISWLLLLAHFLVASDIVFVSKHGYDFAFCGNSTTTACGTMYFASTIINDQHNDYEMIINGQNKTDIINYHHLQNTNRFDPCLPVTFNNDIHITISFNKTLINDMNHWYPRKICENDRNYKNKYMFEGGKSLTINNLFINNYPLINDTYKSYNFAKCYSNTVGISCINCIFNNIISINNYPLFYTFSEIHLIHNEFTNLTVSDDFIYAYFRDDLYYGNRFFRIQNTSFVNIFINQSFLNIPKSNIDLTNIPVIAIDKCQFLSVFVGDSLISDDAWQSQVNITNVEIAVVSGSIYVSTHRRSSSISFGNISVLTEQFNSLNPNGLFYFNYGDIVHMTDMNIVYTINVTNLCEYYGNIYNSQIDALGYYVLCPNPVGLITNYGQIHMDQISIDIIKLGISQIKQHMLPRFYYLVFDYEYDEENDNSGIIVNYLQINITNMYIKESIAHFMFLNYGTLSIKHMLFENSELNNQSEYN